MFYHQETNTYIREGAAFEINGVQYPANWLNLSTPDDKAAHGLVEVVTVGTREDERTHVVTEELVDGELRIINTPKPAEMLAEAAKQQAKAEIERLEREQMLPRATREFMLTFMELNASAEVLAANYGYRAVKAFDEDIKRLRAQLRAQL